MDDVRYPIGKFEYKGVASAGERNMWIGDIADAPRDLRKAVEGLTAEQLDTPYRDGGWTVRQVVHHLPDSHLNAYVRLRLALTEDDPTIKPYEESRWAELQDARTAPAEVSLQLLDALHQRMVALMRSLDDAAWQRTFRHPEYGPFTLEKLLAMYAWHGRHHVAQIAGLRKRKGWNGS
ncbi:MAG: YfiT family bacillithiol transferase [Terriglobales bacterium]